MTDWYVALSFSGSWNPVDAERFETHALASAHLDSIANEYRDANGNCMLMVKRCGFIIRNAETFSCYVGDNDWSGSNQAKVFSTVDDAVKVVRTFYGEVVDEAIDDEGATLAMSGNNREMRIYEVIPV